MTNEERKEQQKAILDEYNRELDSHEDLKAWVAHKKKILLIGLIYLASFYVIQYMALVSINAEVNSVMIILRAVFNLIWFYVFLSPMGNWKLSIMFFVSAFYNFYGFWQLYEKNGSFDAFFTHGPLMAIYFVMSILIPVLYLALGCWLAIPEK